PAMTRKHPLTAWIVDDTGFPKKGTHSVGVTRQYCGQLGKQENCRVAVSLSLATEQASLPVAYQLYLPEIWAQERERRNQAGVPEEIRFQTKPAIALEQIRGLVEEDVPRAPVLADAAYGNDNGFRDGLQQLRLEYDVGPPSSPPALLCMVVLLQGYVGASDAEAVELSLVDLRWQMVLDCLGAATPPFSQGGLLAFRERMIAHEMDRVLLDRTVALVRSGAMTDAEGRSVSKALRAAIDSRPLAGAGKVEDTINLLGHAARSIVQLVSKLTDRTPEEICRKAGIPLLLAPSIKAGLDIDWSDPKQKAMAVDVVERQVSSLQRWVDRHLD